MKKYKLIPVIACTVILLTACGKENDITDKENVTGQSTEQVTTEQETEGVAETETLMPKDLPEMVFFRRNKDEGTFVKASDVKSEWSYHNDIASFYLFPEKADDAGFLYDGFKDYWESLWQSYKDTKSAKLAYEITIKLTDNTEIVKKITNPSDADDIYNYIEIYLYDDIHQLPGAWYSHLTDEKMNDDTIMSSIKITAGVDVLQVMSVKIEAYAYSGEEKCFVTPQSIELIRQLVEE